MASTNRRAVTRTRLSSTRSTSFDGNANLILSRSCFATAPARSHRTARGNHAAKNRHHVPLNERRAWLFMPPQRWEREEVARHDRDLDVGSLAGCVVSTRAGYRSAWPPLLTWDAPITYDEHGTVCEATSEYLEAVHGPPVRKLPVARPAPSNPPSAAGLLTLREASLLARTPSETIRYWIWQGRLVAFKPGRTVLIKESELLALVASRETKKIRAAKNKLSVVKG
jgi:excisionase family DNA binding protein